MRHRLVYDFSLLFFSTHFFTNSKQKDWEQHEADLRASGYDFEAAEKDWLKRFDEMDSVVSEVGDKTEEILNETIAQRNQIKERTEDTKLDETYRQLEQQLRERKELKKNHSMMFEEDVPPSEQNYFASVFSKWFSKLGQSLKSKKKVKDPWWREMVRFGLRKECMPKILAGKAGVNELR